MDTLLQLAGTSLAFLGLSLVVFAPLELLVPARERRHRAPFADWIHFLVNPAFGVFIAVTIIAFVGAVIRSLMPDFILRWTGDQPFFIQLATALVLAEMWGYWAHRLSHQLPWLWRFHRIHHSIEEMSWVSAHRQHPVDVAVTIAGANLPAYILGIDLQPLAAFVLFERCYAVFLHANIDCVYGWLGRFLASPRYHHWHHDMGATGNRHNFAGMFSCLDWLFGTYHEPAEPPVEFGCSEPVPQGYVNQIRLHPPLPPDTKKSN